MHGDFFAEISGQKGKLLGFITLQGYHVQDSSSYLNITSGELQKLAPQKVITTSAQEVLKEHLRTHQNLNSKVEGRLVYQRKLIKKFSRQMFHSDNSTPALSFIRLNQFRKP